MKNDWNFSLMYLGYCVTILSVALATIFLPLINFSLVLPLLDAYVIKLFDRSVDLAQFNTATPLYPICRAWMRNNPSVREPAASPSSPQGMVEEEVGS